MSEHTRGPWEVGQYPWLIDDNAGDELAQVCTSRGEYEANARLIAAAPDLLTACKEMLQRIKEYQDLDGLLTAKERASRDRMIVAVAKAEGGAACA